uniref:Ribosomal protein L6 n=1 Tax=Acavomonas peruviana TaxID=1542312 RepID=V5KV69_9ALVE|nr:ribosomal protein L6 [Acavomonas peruviana]
MTYLMLWNSSYKNTFFIYYYSFEFILSSIKNILKYYTYFGNYCLICFSLVFKDFYVFSNFFKHYIKLSLINNINFFYFYFLNSFYGFVFQSKYKGSGFDINHVDDKLVFVGSSIDLNNFFYFVNFKKNFFSFFFYDFYSGSFYSNKNFKDFVVNPYTGKGLYVLGKKYIIKIRKKDKSL